MPKPMRNTPTPPAVRVHGQSITDGWDNAHPEFFTANNFACRGIGRKVTAQMTLPLPGR